MSGQAQGCCGRSAGEVPPALDITAAQAELASEQPEASAMASEALQSVPEASCTPEVVFQVRGTNKVNRTDLSFGTVGLDVSNAPFALLCPWSKQLPLLHPAGRTQGSRWLIVWLRVPYCPLHWAVNAHLHHVYAAFLWPCTDTPLWTLSSFGSLWRLQTSGTVGYSCKAACGAPDACSWSSDVMHKFVADAAKLGVVE